jgi:hypothetical protein
VLSVLLELRLVDSGRPKGYGPSKRPRRLARPRTPPFHGDNTGSNPVGDAKQNKRLALLVFLFLEGCLVILTAIKDAENGYLVSIHLKRDHNAFEVAGYS